MDGRGDAARLCAALILVVLGVPVAPVPEPVLRRCVGADGGVSYQQTPCAGDAAEAWQRPLPTTVIDGSGEAAPPPVPRPAAAPARRLPAGPRQQEDAQRQRCAQARREADARREREWNRLDFRSRSRLDAEVAEACRR